MLMTSPLDHPRGPSLQAQRLADREAYLARYRRTYLATICGEGGFETDLRAAALREIAALAELVRQFDAGMAEAVRKAATGRSTHHGDNPPQQ
jgi:hypothetical protein